jgi:hypothetical protein
MPQFDVVFEKMELILQESKDSPLVVDLPSRTELDEIDELRRFSAEIQEPDPLSFTTT